MSADRLTDQFQLWTIDEIPASRQRRRSSVDDHIAIPNASRQSTFLEQPYASTDKRVILYKTEMCRTFEETGSCKYGPKCQFAHVRAELRTVPRHPRYKTEICKTFWEQGNCPYGKRCCFIHTEHELRHELRNEVRQEHPGKTKNGESVPSYSPTKTGSSSKLLSRFPKHGGEEHFPISASMPANEAIPNNWGGLLDFVGSPPTIGSIRHLAPIGHRSTALPDPLFDSSSLSHHSSSEDAWEEDSVGLLPSDLINN